MEYYKETNNFAILMEDLGDENHLAGQQQEEQDTKRKHSATPKMLKDPGSKSRPAAISKWNDGLPSDVMFSIFIKQTVRTLFRLRRVCKFWRDVVDSPSFAPIYMTHSSAATTEKSQLSLISYPATDDNPMPKKRTRTKQAQAKMELFVGGKQESKPLDNNPIAQFVNAKRFRVDSVCYGVFCFKDIFGRGEVFLFNPLRGGELLVLPPAKASSTTSQFFGLVLDNRTQTFKLVHLYAMKSVPSRVLTLAAEVHELGTSSWRDIPAIPPRFVDGNAISAYGDIHWKSTITNCPEEDFGKERFMISFDSKEEGFRLNPLPEDEDGYYSFQLIDYKGFLGMSSYSSAKIIYVWLLKDYEKNKWVRNYKVSPSFYWYTETPNWDVEFAAIVGAWGNRLVFSAGVDGFGYDIWYCCPGTRDLEIWFQNSKWKIFTYTSCLLSLKNYGSLMKRNSKNYFNLQHFQAMSQVKKI